MDRITIDEFIEEVRYDHSALKDGHDLGLIIDDVAEDAALFERLVAMVRAKAAAVVVGVDALLTPEALERAVASCGNGEAMVLVRATAKLTPQHYAALRSLVYHHGLMSWNQAGTQGVMVSFPSGVRFVLVVPRDALEQSWSEYPQLAGILGVTLSCDSARKEDV